MSELLYVLFLPYVRYFRDIGRGFGGDFSCDVVHNIEM